MQGVVSKVLPDQRFGLIQGEDERELIFDEAGMADAPFDGLEPGSHVEFEVDEETVDVRPRAIAVRLCKNELPAYLKEVLILTKAGPSGRGGRVQQEMPADVEGDPVDEASWESFPASDPPATGGVT